MSYVLARRVAAALSALTNTQECYCVPDPVEGRMVCADCAPLHPLEIRGGDHG